MSHCLVQHEIQRQGDFMPNQDLHAGGTIQAKYGVNRGIVQLNKGLYLRNF